MNQQEMINHIEQYLLVENNEINNQRIINKEWIEILTECLRLLKQEQNK